MSSAALIGLGLFIVSGCAMRMNASAHVDRGQDFSVYRTFEWGPPDALPTGDARLDGDPFFRDRMQGAVEKQLRARGLLLADDAPPDLVIHYHANIAERIDVIGVERSYGYTTDVLTPQLTRYEGGTLVLDVIDRRTQRLIWRGWAQTGIEDALRDRSRLSTLIDEAAKRMMLHFPRAVEPTSSTPATRREP
jgi:hypothetical protein